MLTFAVILIAFALVAPTAAAQTSFGSDLSRPANNTFATCFNGFDEGPYAPYHYQPRQSSCTWAGVGQVGTGAESSVAPATGTVTSVRVKVGGTTGPMQFVVLRYYRKDNPSDPGHPSVYGPFWNGESPAFTPDSGKTSTIGVNLPVKSEFDPSLNAYVFDAIGLSVLAPNVPIPANDTGDRSGNYLAAAWYPRVSSADQANGRTDGYPPAGVVPLYNATLSGGQAGSGGQNPLQQLASIGLAKTTATARGRFVSVPLICRLTTACNGRLQLRRIQARGALVANKKRAAPIYGTRSFKIKAGATKTINVKLTKAGRRLMAKHKRVKVAAVMSLGKGKTAKVYTSQLTLKRAARRKRR